MRLLRAWRARLAEQAITSGRLLRSVTRDGRLGASLSADALSDLVQAAARRAGLPDADTYSAHSLRAGGATAAYRAGAPVSTIAAHGRWASGSPVVLSYIRSVDRLHDTGPMLHQMQFVLFHLSQSHASQHVVLPTALSSSSGPPAVPSAGWPSYR